MYKLRRRLLVGTIVVLFLLLSAPQVHASWYWENWHRPSEDDVVEEDPVEEDPTDDPAEDDPVEKPERSVVYGGWARRWITPDPDPDPDPDPEPEPEPEPEPDPPGDDCDFADAYPSNLVRAGDESELLDMVNQERVEEGLSPLAHDPQLTELARAKCWDMLEYNYFSHTSPNYGTVYDMLRAADYPFVYGGENLAKAGNVWVVHYRLMNSSGHRRNILHPNFTHVGIAVLDGSPSGVIVTQVFVGR